ncbi:hypothetical protein [Acidaminococcus massiliensis]|uniref:hypothetical protein n=1 Tax=Acidaminococcus massiliensis TaxID=1852375 RepID=UPI00094E3990|nr:hypothetical protein [Acidaminococcus massiliensis]
MKSGKPLFKSHAQRLTSHAKGYHLPGVDALEHKKTAGSPFPATLREEIQCKAGMVETGSKIYYNIFNIHAHKF